MNSRTKPRLPHKTDLRAFQSELMSRMTAPSVGGQSGLSQLAFLAGGKRWLCQLQQAEEVLVPPPVTPVPLTQAWFIGLTNVRGNLYSIVDFSVFLGAPPTASGNEARLMLLSARNTGAVNVALLVQQVYGLRNVGGFAPTGLTPEDPSWCVQNWMDAEGTAWREMNLIRLAQEPAFLKIGR